MQSSNSHSTIPELRRMIVCGKKVKGHRAGQALIALARNGIDKEGRIIGAFGRSSLIKIDK